MHPLVQRLQTFFGSLGVPEAWLPLLPFALGLGAIYLIIFGLVRLLVAANLIRQRTGTFYLFISPWIVGFGLFTLGPMLYSVYLSLTDYDLLSPPVWAGLDNYKQALQDERLRQALIVTFVYALISIPLNVVLSFLVSLLMNMRLHGIYLFRTLFYLPVLVSGVAQAVLFSRVFDPNTGIINTALSYLGIAGPRWLLDPNWALTAVIIMSLWTVGGNMIIYLAGLQDIPDSQYEAAVLDGANGLQSFRHVTLPAMTPILFFNVVTGLIGAMQTFTPGYIFNQGGPADSLLFYVFYLYQNAFAYFQMGYGAALAWILFVIVMLLTLLVFRSSSFWVFYEAEQLGGK